MNIIFLLIPLSLILVGVIIVVLFWAIRSGQFDDMEGPAHRILMDDDKPDTKSSSELENEDDQ
ncbi:MAG: cbb3-type cytochrome oxidase assembly protein CcoS [Gammaproteobacteria bacterium]